MKFVENVTVGMECSPDASNIHERVTGLMLIPVTVLILVANCLVLAVTVPNKCFHTPTYAFISSLAVSDILVGIVSIVTIATEANEDSEDLCLLRIGLSIAATSASMWSLTFVAVDRYIGVKGALVYRSVMSKTKTFAGILWTWVVSLVVGFLPLMGWRTDQYNHYCSFMYVLTKFYILILFVVSGLVPLSIVSLIYTKLFHIARFHIKRMESIEKLLRANRDRGLFGFSSRSIRSIKTFGLVFGCIFVTWLPFIIVTLSQFFLMETNCLLQEIVGTYLLALGYSNSFLNPYIYVLGTKEFRMKVYKMYKRRWKVSVGGRFASTIQQNSSGVVSESN